MKVPKKEKAADRVRSETLQRLRDAVPGAIAMLRRIAKTAKSEKTTTAAVRALKKHGILLDEPTKPGEVRRVKGD